MWVKISVCFSLLLANHSIWGLSRVDLFPFGEPQGDKKLPSDNEDVSSAEIALSTNVKFFSRQYGSIYVRFVVYILFLNH